MPRRALTVVLVATALAAASVGCGSSPSSSTTQAGTVGAPGRQVANGPVDPGVAAPEIQRYGHSRAPVPMLMYHVIAAAPPGATYSALWVAPAALRAQVAALGKAGFRAVTLDAVLDGWSGQDTLPRHPVVLTFDDGYLSQGKEATAILGAVRWPGVLNLAWHNLGTPGGLTRGRIRSMIRAGWEIDAHSLTHPDLTKIGAAQLEQEVAGSRAAIRKAFGVPVDAFCYPAGKFDATVEAAVKAAGYRAATTVEPGAATASGDRYALPRIRVNAGDSAATVVREVRSALGSAR